MPQRSTNLADKRAPERTAYSSACPDPMWKPGQEFHGSHHVLGQYRA